MLFNNSHWRFAFERNPEREARLLCIANANAPQPGDAADNPAEQEFTDEALSKMGTDELLRLLVKDAHKKTKQAVEKPAPTEKPKAKTETTESGSTPQEQIQETIRERLQKGASAAAKVREKMQATLRRMENEELMESLKKNAPAEVVQQWEKSTQTLRVEEFNTSQEKLFMDELLKFWEGDTPPVLFQTQIQEYLGNLPYGYAEIGNGIAEAIKIHSNALFPSQQTEEEWLKIDKSSRLEHIERILEDVQMESWLTHVSEHTQEQDKELDEASKQIDTLEKEIDKMQTPEQVEEATNFISTLRSTRFYSINDYLKGAQKYWAALKSTWEQRGDRYSSVVARKLGKALQPVNIWPFYGQEVARVLDHQLDSKNDEETKQTHDMLEHEGANWEHLFANTSHHKGEFWQFAYSNPNKARGVIEYAADHGFLYDLDDNITNTDHPIFGVKLADICSDWSDDPNRIKNYYSLLRVKNSSGRDKEEKEGYSTDVATDNVPMFIEKIEDEMDDYNLWKTVGICRRALERGLWSEIAAWVTTTIMNKLREHPELRKHTPQIFFDLVGKLSMYNTAFTAGWLKAHRKTLREWARTGDEHVLDDTEIHTFTDIENEIKAKDPGTDYTTKEGIQELNHRTAEVLAGRAVKLPGGYIHIYESRFKKYRNGAADTFQSLANAHKEDSDYATQVTEKSMLPQTAVDDILKFTSTREFTEKSWVAGYFHSLVEQAKQLADIPALAEAHTNFCNEVREKMDHYFGSYITEKSQTGKDACNRQFALMDGKIPAMASMVAANLISFDLMQRSADPTMLLKQLKDYFPEFVSTKGSGISKK